MIKFFTTWFFKNSNSQRPGGSKDNESYQFCKMSSKEVGKKNATIFVEWYFWVERETSENLIWTVKSSGII